MAAAWQHPVVKKEEFDLGMEDAGDKENSAPLLGTISIYCTTAGAKVKKEEPRGGAEAAACPQVWGEQLACLTDCTVGRRRRPPEVTA